MAPALVVADRVVDQVGDHPLEQLPLSVRPRRIEVVADPDRHLLRSGVQIGDAVGRERGEVDGLVPAGGGLAAGQHQQALDQPLAPVDRVPYRLAHLAQLAPAGLGIGERHVDLGAHDRQRRPQLVRGVGDEVPLALEGVVEPLEHPVEGVGQLLELVRRPAERDPLAQVLPRHAPGRPGDPPQRAQGAAGQQPPRHDRHQRHHPERQQVLDQQPVQRVAAKLRPDRRCDRHLRGARREPKLGTEGRRTAGRQHPQLLELLADVVEVRARVEVVADQQIAERQQDGAGDQEDDPVEDRQSQPDRGRGPAHQASL